MNEALDPIDVMGSDGTGQSRLQSVRVVDRAERDDKTVKIVMVVFVLAVMDAGA